jgi:formylglycine-generating enzyme required for sulfatase activity
MDSALAGRPRALQPRINLPCVSIGHEMILIPAGCFLMGSKEREDEKPVHHINLPDYRISKYPVTNIQFARFVQATGYHTDAEQAEAEYTWRTPLGKGSDIRHRMDRPVEYVTWYDALMYAAAVGKRLPTEAEWEKAARGSDGRDYPWGNRFDRTRANMWRGKRLEATPVWVYPGGASPYGVMDLLGNVEEWCSSLYQPYPYDAADGRENLDAEGPRVVRGGSWYEYRVSLRSHYRGERNPTRCVFDTGFRVAESVSLGR